MSELSPEIVEYLRAQDTLTLATATLNGLPHAASFVYVNEDVAFFFATLPGTQTARNINQNPLVSFTVDTYSRDWRHIKGIQAAGECETLLNPQDIRHVAELFQQKYPFLTGQLTSNRSFFRITPSEVYFINNETSTDEHRGLTDYQSSLVYSVFSQLPVASIENVEARLEQTTFEPGQIVVRQGAPADKFFIIVDGSVEVVQDEGEGTTRQLTVLRGGEFFGEIAIMRDTPRTATVRALTPTTLLAMDRDTFRGLVAQALGTTQDFGAVIQERLL